MARLLHTTQRWETVADRVAGWVAAQQQGQPLGEAVLAVPAQGWARWLRLQLARRLGAVAGVRMTSPLALVEEWLRGAGQAVDGAAREPSRHVWRVLEVLADEGWLARPEVAELRVAVAAAATPSHRLDLAWSLAEAFDSYLVHRPQEIVAWSAGRGLAGGWQAALWREVETRFAGELPTPLPVALQAAAAAPPRWAELAVVATSPLPPLVLQALAQAAQTVHLHLVVPTPEWLDYEGPPPDGDGPEAVVKVLGREALVARAVALDLNFEEATEVEDVPPSAEAPATALAGWQASWRELQWPEKALPSDCTVQWVAAPNPTRAAEGLRDALLAARAADPTLEPSQMLVLLGDPTLWPLVRAVLLAEDEPTLRLPVAHGLDDGTPPGVESGWLAWLRFPQGRATVREGLALLENPWVMATLDFSEEDLTRVTDWARAGRLSWGLDAAHRQQWGAPPGLCEGTWAEWLDRLTLGAVVDWPADNWWAGLVPLPVGGGEANLTLQKLRRWWNLGQAFARAHREPRPPAAWGQWLSERLAEVTAELPARWTSAMGLLRQVLGLLAAAPAGAAGPVPLAAVALWLERMLPAGDSPAHLPLLVGGVNVAPLALSRIFPARWVAVVGLNDFPRPTSRPAWSLLRTRPQPTDPDAAVSDRQALLQAILAARDGFYLSFICRTPDGTRERPAPAAVALLAENFRRCRGGEEKAGAMAWPTLSALGTALSRWAPAVLPPGEAGRFSVAEARAASRQLQPATPLAAWASEELSEALLPTPEPEETVELFRLVQFGKNSSLRWLEAIGAPLPAEEGEWPEHEPQELDTLGQHGLRQQLLGATSTGTTPLPPGWWAATGAAPAGTPSAAHLAVARHEVRRAFRRAGLSDAAPLAEPRLALAQIGPATVRGHLRWHGGEVVVVSASKWKGAVALESWLTHLLATAATQRPVTTLTVARDTAQRWQPVPVAEAEAHLAEWLRAAATGQRRPVPYFAETSWRAGTAPSDEPPEKLAEALARAWADEGGGYARPEGRSAAVVRVWGEVDSPLAIAGFAELAQALWAGAETSVVSAAAEEEGGAP